MNTKNIATLSIAGLLSSLLYAKPLPPKPIPLDFTFSKISENEDQDNIQVDIKAKTYSRSKHETYCWSATMPGNIPGYKHNIEERFFLPAKGIFTAKEENFNITSSTDQKNWTIKQTMSTVEDNQLLSCWTLDANDPLGDYKMEVFINGHKQKPVNFKVVE